MNSALWPDSLASEVCGWETSRALQLGKRLIPLLWRELGQLKPREHEFYVASEGDERSDADWEYAARAGTSTAHFRREPTPCL
jgi:hypothetical protein